MPQNFQLVYVCHEMNKVENLCPRGICFATDPEMNQQSYLIFNKLQDVFLDMLYSIYTIVATTPIKCIY